MPCQCGKVVQNDKFNSLQKPRYRFLSLARCKVRHWPGLHIGRQDSQITVARRLEIRSGHGSTANNAVV
jgi:hypothetical protein